MTLRMSGERRAAVIGTGRMGHGIALELARGGFRVRLFDSVPEHVTNALEEARNDAGDLVAAGVLRADEVDTVTNRLEPSGDLENAVSGAEFVVEAVAENLQVKRDVFAELDRRCPPPTILASNTSSISISEIARDCTHPERAVLAHWVLPPHLIPVVEVAPGDSTDPRTVETTCDLLQSIGKWPIRISRDIPGYILNRLQFALVREAMHLVADGVTSVEDIDNLVRGSLARRWPSVGVFRQADMAGLDVYERIFTYLAADLNSSADPPPNLSSAVSSGHTGAREGHGFYDWKPGDLDSYLVRRNTDLVRMLREDRAG